MATLHIWYTKKKDKNKNERYVVSSQNVQKLTVHGNGDFWNHYTGRQWKDETNQ